MLSERLRRLRGALGLSQEQLAHRLGVSFATVNRWENSRTHISARAEALLADLEAAVGPAPDGQDEADRSALPVVHSSFVGREAELAAVAALLPVARLLCLTGPGGAGKTRLAVEAVRRHAGASVSFVALERLRDEAALVAAVAAALGVRDQPGSPTASLLEAAAAPPGLLLLDGAEHLRDEVAALAERLLAAGPGLRIVVTSRRILGVAGETSWAVPPLDSPAAGAADADVLASDAVTLFVTRAKERLAAFDPTRLPAHQLNDLCRRLDGLPLAIELIAGWIGTLSVPEIVQRHAALLSGSTSSLDAVVGHSYDLLSAEDQELVTMLSVFAGPFLLEDAAAVCGRQDTELAHGLRALVDSSWLSARPDGDRNRFALLETTRRFAAGRLAEREVAARGPDAAERHYAHFAALAAEGERGLAGPDMATWSTRIEAASADLEQALWWCADTGRTDLGLGLSASLWRWWLITGRMTVGRGWLQAFLQGSRTQTIDDEVRARARSAAAVLAAESGDYRDAVAQALPALRTFEASGRRDPAALAATILGSAHRYLGERDLARRYFRQAMELRQAVGDRRGVSVALNNLALLALDDDDLVAASRLFQESLDIKRQLGDPRSVAIGLANQSDVLIRLGRLVEAAAVLDEAVGLAADLGNLQLIGTLRCNQGDLAASRQDWKAAADQYQAGVVAYREAGHTHDVVVALVGLGRATHRLGERTEAAKLLREAETLAIESSNAKGLADVRVALAETGEESVVALPDGITLRQADVLGLLATGASNKEIAATLGLRVATVERHVASVYRKLGLRGRVEATRYALAHGLSGPRR